MGGVVNTVTKGIGTAIGAVATGGTSLIPGSPTAKLGNTVGNIGTLGTSGQKGPFPNIGGNGSGDFQAPTVGGTQDPLSVLTQSGGAPLLTNIALGADVNSSIMGYFGASGDYNTWYNGLPANEQQAIQGLQTQLTQVQTNTNLRNTAVQNLANDYPNLMSSGIAKYSAIADSATQKMMSQALDAVSAKQAAGGNFSSGATAAAAARVGAEYAGQNLQFGAGMAQNDFNQQLNIAGGLQAFQQKMLGQGASQGFNAIQSALGRTANAGIAQAGFTNDAMKSNTQQNNAMFGALGSLGGTILGGAFGGAPGAAVGGTVMGSLFGSPRLNISGSGMGGSTGNPFGMGSPAPTFGGGVA